MSGERFTRLDELGHGAMGTVWRAADHAQGGKIVALKTIRAASAITAEQRLQFREEFRAMTRLRHPNTVEVFDYGQLDAETQFITMELVPGRELAAMVAAGPLPLAEVYPLLAQLLQALSFIHSRLFVHRDIKAANVRVRDDGTLKLMDFGLMVRLGMPATGRISGTPGYLAPEVVKGGTIDQRTDLYAVGCLAYELLTGTVPFTGRLIDVVRAHANEAPLAIATRRPDVPERLAAIVHRLLAKDPAERHADAEAVLADLADLAGLDLARPTLDQKKSYLVAGALIGREAEVATLTAALDAARAGRRQAVYLSAPAGVGKSRLLQEVALAAKLADLPVITTTCHEGGMAPFEGVAEALAGLDAVATPEERAPGDLVARLAKVAARTPVVWCVEDLHWADGGTIETLNRGLAELADAPLLVVATMRGDETPGESRARAPIAEGLARELALAPFDADQVRALLGAMLGPIRLTPEYARYLVEATGGNAFFVTEALRAMMEEQVLAFRDGAWHFPSDTGNLALLGTIQATIARRLARLSPAALRLAEVAAVLGAAPTRELLLAVGDFEEEALFEGLDELIARQFLVREGAAYRFPHARVRETLYAGLTPAARSALHGRCGEALAARPDTPLAVLAHHFGQGPDVERAYRYAREAGDAARDAGLAEEAVHHWRAAERALRSRPGGEADPRLGDLWWAIGKAAFYAHPALAIEALEQLIPRLESACYAGALRKLFMYELWLTRRMPEAIRRLFYGKLTQAAALSHDAPTGGRRFGPLAWADAMSRLHQAQGYLGVAYAYAGWPRRGLDVVERAMTFMPFEDTDTVMEGAQHSVKASLLQLLGHLDACVEHARRAEAVLDRHPDHPLGRVARIGAYGCPLGTEVQGYKPDPAALTRLLAACEAGNDRHGHAESHAHFAAWHARTGRLDEARRYLDLVTQHCRRVGEPPLASVYHLRPFVAFVEGEHEAALGMVRHARQLPHLVGRQFAALLRLRALEAEIRLELGDAAAARALADEALAEAIAREMGLEAGLARLVRARAAAALGASAAAGADLDAVLAEAEAGPRRNPWLEGVALRARGELALAEGRLDAAGPDLHAALAIAARPEQDDLLGQGLAHHALGRLAAARGDRPAAEAAYREAGARFFALKNRHRLFLVTRDLDALLAPPAPAPATAAETVVPAAPAPEAVMERWAALLHM